MITLCVHLDGGSSFHLMSWGDHPDEVCTTCVGGPGGMAPPLGSLCCRTSVPCTTGPEKGSLPEMSVVHVCAQHCVKLPNQRMELSPFQSGRAASCPCSRMKPSVWKYHLLGEPHLVFIDVFKFYLAN